MKEFSIVNNIIYKPFKLLKLWKNNSLKTDVLGINERNIEYVYRHNSKANFKLADDKILCKQVLQKFNIPCPKTYAVINGFKDFDQAWEKIQEYDAMAIKPANGHGGGGIMILKKSEDKWFTSGKLISKKEVFSHFARIIMGTYSKGNDDRIIIEEFINTHKFFKKIFPIGVPDIRIILLNNKPISAMLRMPTLKSNGKANLHQGGLGIGLDLNSGRLQKAYDGNDYHYQHPDSKCTMYGHMIPMWFEILSLSVATSKAFPLNYLGVDLVLDRNHGPMILEINVRPGLGIQLANRKGLKAI